MATQMKATFSCSLKIRRITYFLNVFKLVKKYLPDLRIYNEPLFTEFIEENVERKPYSKQKKEKKRNIRQ